MFVSKECFRSIEGYQSWHTETKGPCGVRLKIGPTKNTSILECLNTLTASYSKVIYTNIWP